MFKIWRYLKQARTCALRAGEGFRVRIASFEAGASMVLLNALAHTHRFQAQTVMATHRGADDPTFP
jgi:hypothetical protein